MPPLRPRALAAPAIAAAVAAIAAPAALAQCWTEDQNIAPDWEFIPPVGGVSFGQSVDIEGDLALIGAPASDDFRGAAYVFRNVGGVWTREDRIQPADAQVEDYFGQAVAIDGGRLLISAHYDTTPAGADAGLVRIFERIAGVWTQTGEIAPSDPAPGMRFGHDVVLRGDQLLIAAGNRTPQGMYLFERSGGAWVESAVITRPPGAPGFGGSSSDIAGDLAVVGVGSAATPAGDYAGIVEVYRRTAGAWSFAQALAAPDGGPNQNFGASVVTDGERILVGAIRALGTDDVSRGAVYEFADPDADGSFQFIRRIDPPAEPLLEFNAAWGAELILRGDRLLVASPNALGLFASPGAIYMLAFDGAAWAAVDILTNAIPTGYLGRSIALDGLTLLSGRPNANSDAGDGMGAATFFTLAPDLAVTAHPQSFSAAAGAPGFFRVDTPPGASPAFQWRRNGQPLADGDGIAGASTAFLSFASLAADHAGTYDCLITSPCSPAVATTTATLTVRCLPDFNADGVLNSNDISAFLSAWLQALQNACP